MKIDILTLFPEMFRGPFDESILRRAQHKKLVEINIRNLRDWAIDKHKIVDDRPYGGGTGMILKVDIVDKAVQELRSKTDTKVILLDTRGNKFTQNNAKRLSKRENIILIAGHYEGVDYRIHEHIADEVISIGDYVLTGGEIPAMVIVDAIVRLIPGVLEKPQATQFESFSPSGPEVLRAGGQPTTNDQRPTTLLEYPQYTRPEIYKNWKVPNVLLSGNHKEIEKWKVKEAQAITKKTRPDLLE